MLHDREQKAAQMQSLSIYAVGNRQAVANNESGERDYLPMSLSNWDCKVYYNARTMADK